MKRFGAALPALPVATLACMCALTMPSSADPAPDAGNTAATATEATPSAPQAAAPASSDTATSTTAAAPTPPATTSALPDTTTTPASSAPASPTAETTPSQSASPETASPETTSPASADTNSASRESTEPAPAAAATLSEPPAATAAAAAPAAPAVNPAVVDAVRAKLAANEGLGKAFPEQVTALKAFYEARSEPLWLKDGAFTDNAKALIAEIKKADDYGLEAKKFELPDLASGADASAQAEAELKLDVAALTYAHYARGGRITPLSLSNILDMQPPVKESAVVLSELAGASSADAYLRRQHPQHPQFEKLRQALLKARGPQEEVVDEALQVKIPATKLLRPGDEDPAVALIRKRLKVETQNGTNSHFYDAALELAVKTYQKDKGLRPDGIIGSGTRNVMNGEGDADRSDPTRQIDRIIANMERWRWLPADLGSVYVVNNIPEFRSRIFKGQEVLLDQKMIVGQPSWPTPVMAAEMKTIVFHPTWGVPDGIKTKELLPRLKRAGGGGNNFFEQLFGGGSSGGGRVLKAYKLQPSLNGRPVDPDSIDWSKVDIRRYSFIQPPGTENPLGKVKFLFPNRHDVYMHDTPQRNLFSQTFRALSHGCMRLDEPKRTAEVLLSEDKGWSAEKVDDMYDHSTNTVALDKIVPVYLTYFTLAVDDSGKLNRFTDIYGHDQRVLTALAGRPVRYTAPDDDIVASTGADDAPPVTNKKKTKKEAASSRRETRSAGDILADSLSGLIAN